MVFPTEYTEILNAIDAIDPIQYGKTRNYLNGAVTRLSPYISRGVISTKQVAAIVLAKGYKPDEIESLLKELCWRDYFQQVWIALDEGINKDIHQPQPNCHNNQMSEAVLLGNTGIIAIDTAINELKSTGYMHNHLRMYVASIACNIAHSHWSMPSQWMYYYLLDADGASNTLSWQWVAGSFSKKKYFANQENINRYSLTNQTNTFLDVPYENFESIATPSLLQNTIQFTGETKLPETAPLVLDESLPTYVYNFYNLDCNWDSHIQANRVLLLEPGFFKKYPVCNNTIKFIMDLSKNIPNIQVYVGEFDEAFCGIAEDKINYKEHPTNKHYKGIKHSRDWMFDEVKGYYPSFFSYWKQCEKQLKKWS
jgi:deoxyribodipyrimidine photo-lyase